MRFLLTYNPNMPMRFFIYGGALYDKYATMTRYYRFSSKLQKIPRPKRVCFYNGTVEQPEEACRPLQEYAWLVDTVRRHEKEKMDPEAAIDLAINELPDEFVVKAFIV